MVWYPVLNKNGNFRLVSFLDSSMFLFSLSMEYGTQITVQDWADPQNPCRHLRYYC